MKVKDVMSTNLVWVTPSATAMDAALKMREEKVTSLPVVEEGELIGITTDRLLAMHVIAEGLDPRTVKIKDLMSENLVSVRPEMPLVKAAQLLQEMEIRYLPVVDDKNHLIGILSVSDIGAFIEIYIDSILHEFSARVKRRVKN